MSKTQWALVGGDSLIGKEMRDVIEERDLPVSLRRLSPDPTTALLTQDDEEAVVMEPLSAEALSGAAAVFLAGSAEQDATARSLAASAGLHPVWIDLRGALESLPESRLRAPMVEPELRAGEPGAVETIAHPAAAHLARFLSLLHRHAAIRQSVVNIFEPASARGQRGIDEMHQQAVSLLSFQPMPKTVFDAQAVFNLLPRYGEQAPESLAGAEEQVERQLVSLLGPYSVPLPSLRLIHAPVFHAYVFSAWVEFENRPAAATLRGIFTQEGIDLRTRDTEPPSNLAVAGQSGITLDDVQEDPANARAAWFFFAADNLRTIAENAVMVAGLSLKR